MPKAEWKGVRSETKVVFYPLCSKANYTRGLLIQNYFAEEHDKFPHGKSSRVLFVYFYPGQTFYFVYLNRNDPAPFMCVHITVPRLAGNYFAPNGQGGSMNEELFEFYSRALNPA